MPPFLGFFEQENSQQPGNNAQPAPYAHQRAASHVSSTARSWGTNASQRPQNSQQRPYSISAADVSNEGTRMLYSDLPAKPCGVGLGLHIKPNGALAVQAIAPGGPCAATGKVCVGDVLVAVDKENVYKKPFAEVTKRILGQEGTYVRLQFTRRSGETVNSFEIQVQRSVQFDNPAKRGQLANGVGPELTSSRQPAEHSSAIANSRLSMPTPGSNVQGNNMMPPSSRSMASNSHSADPWGVLPHHQSNQQDRSAGNSVRSFAPPQQDPSEHPFGSTGFGLTRESVAAHQEQQRLNSYEEKSNRSLIANENTPIALRLERASEHGNPMQTHVPQDLLKIPSPMNGDALQPKENKSNPAGTLKRSSSKSKASGHALLTIDDLSNRRPSRGRISMAEAGELGSLDSFRNLSPAEGQALAKKQSEQLYFRIKELDKRMVERPASELARMKSNAAGNLGESSSDWFRFKVGWTNSSEPGKLSLSNARVSLNRSLLRTVAEEEQQPTASSDSNNLRVCGAW